MRAEWLLLALLALPGCSSRPANSSTLILNDPYWERVNVEVVITRRSDCDSRAEGYIDTKQVVMRKATTERFDFPNGATICWRHDRDPNNPRPGAWSDWTKATTDPGATAEAEL